MNASRTFTTLLGALVASLGLTPSVATAADWPQYDTNPFVIRLDIAKPRDSGGSVIVADLDGDARPDYLVTVPWAGRSWGFLPFSGYIAAYANDGRKLWIHRARIRLGGPSERVGLPGHHAPGVQAADVDGDGRAEVLFLTRDGTLHVLDGSTGGEKWKARPPSPQGTDGWEHLVEASFRSRGDRDLLLQSTNSRGYRMGRYLAAFAIEDLAAGVLTPLWQRHDFVACAHNGARVADLDGDGRDEVIGGTIVGPEGRILNRIPLKGHIDSIFIYDVRPDLPGLEVVALEEGGGNRVFLYNRKQVIWISHYRHWEPQNAAVGEFDPQRPGLEIWCRSRFNEHQKPFVFDARGELIAAYEMDDVAPEGWTVRGVEVIWTIDWTGGPKQLAAAKERHRSGDVALFDPISGRFVQRFPEKADRLYVADVSGDWREELIVLNGDELHIYHNEGPNPNPDRPRLWSRNAYRRSKMTWNYYSP